MREMNEPEIVRLARADERRRARSREAEFRTALRGLGAKWLSLARHPSRLGEDARLEREAFERCVKDLYGLSWRLADPGAGEPMRLTPREVEQVEAALEDTTFTQDGAEAAGADWLKTAPGPETGLEDPEEPLQGWVDEAAGFSRDYESGEGGFTRPYDMAAELQVPPAEGSVPWSRYKAFLGKQVRVRLGTETDGVTPVVVEGKLLGFGDGGEFEVEESDGAVHYCWPMLEVEEVP